MGDSRSWEGRGIKRLGRFSREIKVDKRADASFGGRGPIHDWRVQCYLLERRGGLGNERGRRDRTRMPWG